MAVFLPAPLAEAVRFKGRRSDSGGALGTVASASQHLLLQPGHCGDQYSSSDHYLYQPGDLLRLCLHEDEQYLGAGCHALHQ